MFWEEVYQLAVSAHAKPQWPQFQTLGHFRSGMGCLRWVGFAHSKRNESKYWVRSTEVVVVGRVGRQRAVVDDSVM
jgi:hypothetical protein